MTLFKRKIYQEMLRWKKSLQFKKTALIIKGLRQIGKTTIVKKFAEENFENVVYIDFMNDINARSFFQGDLNVNLIITFLSSFYVDTKFIPYKTVLIFDEIQECMKARSAIKAFMLDGRYEIIATGSLIGLRGYNNIESNSIPVGFEQIIKMNPMDFEEYLWAIGIKDDVINNIKTSFKELRKIEPALNNQIMKYFKEYLCVGGMPEAVKAFIISHNMQDVRYIQTALINSFKDDFGKHLGNFNVTSINTTLLGKIIDVFNSIPTQLAKENKKFVYQDIKVNARGREYIDAINWLEEYGLIVRAFNLNLLELPLEGNKNYSQFKIYFADTGLFIALLDERTSNKILSNSLKIYKGAIYENVFADAYSKLNKNLYYFHKSSGLEIDFVTLYNDQITLIEVKAKNNKAKSLREVLTNKSKYNVSSNFKLIDGNIGKDGLIQTIPLYLASLID